MSSAFNSLSLIVKMDIVKGHHNGTEKTLIKDMAIIPVIQLEKELEGKFYLQVQPLKDLLDSENEKPKSYIEKAAHYADLALGSGWRK
jgi:hypothetical protein